MKTKALIIIMSHLSDVQEMLGFSPHNECELIKRINFAKWLLVKYPDTNVEIDPDAEYALFNAPMSKDQIEYWLDYSEDGPPTSRDFEETLKEAQAEWNSNADEPIDELGAQVIKTAADFFNATGSINVDIILAMITQLQ